MTVVARTLALLLASLPTFASLAGMEARDQVRLSRAASRCSKLAELISCDEALNIKPNDPELLVAEADALVQMKRPGEAIGVYRNALTVAAKPDVVDPKIDLAQLQRHLLLNFCTTREGAAAERACESAWLPGAPDEVTVFKRRGLLLLGQAQPSAALDAYMAAARLSPKDRGVARDIVNLRGRTRRKDAPTLTALGAALVTLGRPAEAIAPLRQALRLSPDLATAKERLRIAEHDVAANAETAPPDTQSSVVIDAGAVSIGPYTNEAELTRSH